MYRKALIMDDPSTAQKILDAATPKEAGKLGREVQNYNGETWKREVDGVAERCQWLKFSQVKECREALLSSEDKVIAEASPADRNWGIGFRGDEAAGREGEWGRNILGRALMRIRERLRREEGRDGREVDGTG